jgi:hypothetical protein
MKPLCPVLAIIVIAVGCGSAPAGEFHEVITFREPLGRTWTDELVHYDVRPADGRVTAASFALADADGKPVPVQVEVLDGKPDAVRRARVWFKITLPKDQQVFHRLSWNDEGRAAAPPDAAPMVRRDGDRLILSTGAAEAAIAAPPKPPAAPVDFKNAPAPILGVRPAGDKTWYGSWALAGPARVREVRTTIEAAGPLWAEVRLKYAFERTGQSYDVTLRAVRGEPWIDVVEKYRLPDESLATLTLADPLKPAEILWMPWFVGRDGRTEPAYDVHRVRLGEKLAADKPLATLRPRWCQVRDNAQVCLAVGSGDGRAAVGAVMTCPGDWTRPYDQFVTVRGLEGGRGIAMEFPLAEGRRRWALLAGPAERFDTKAELQQLIRRNADVPLDRVLNDWVLQWPRDAANPAPHILTTWEQLQEIRAEIAAGVDSPAARLVKRVLGGEVPGDRRLAEFLAGRRDDMGASGLDAAAVLDRSYQDEALSPAAWPRRMASAMRLADLSAAGKPAGGAAAALLGHVFCDPHYWPPAAAGWDAGTSAHFADMYTAPIYAAALMPDHPHARKWMAAGLAALREDLQRAAPMPDGAGAACPGDQAAALAPMLALMRTAQHSGLDDPFGGSAVRLSLEYLRNLHTPPDPRLGRRVLAPIGDAPPWQDAVGALFGVAAAGIRRADPQLAAVWMAMYHDYYGEDGSGDLARDVLLADPSAPAARPEEAPWPSRRYAGFGAVLRSRAGTAGETFAAFKCGASRGNYHGDELSFHFCGAGRPIALDWNCGKAPRAVQEHMHNRVTLGDDENMDGVGELLAMETAPAGDLAVGQVRADRLRKMPHYPHEAVRGAAYPRRALASESRYRRFLLLVKHPPAGQGQAGGALEDYLVIRDELVSTEPATFNLFVLARSVRQEDRTFTFDGQLAADAVVFMATPDPERVKLDRWAWPKQDESSMIPKDFRAGTDRWRTGELQQWLRVTEVHGRPFLAVLYPHRKGAAPPQFEPLAGGKGVRVTLGDSSEEVYLATDPAPEAGGQAVIRRSGRAVVILKAKALPPL